MKTLYEAANLVEAQMLADLLNQEGFAAHIQGGHLQGAVGELPAAGLVRLQIDDERYLAARAIIERWERAQPSELTADAPRKSRSNRLVGFALGVVAGVLGSYLFYRTPVTERGIDYNGDGKLDVTWYNSVTGRSVRTETDRNFDGKIDYIEYYDSKGVIESSKVDDNFDGVFEGKYTYLLGSVKTFESDSDGDGFVDVKSYYQNGVWISTDYINPATGYPGRVEYLKNGTVVWKAEVDTDKDGKLDTRHFYTPLGEITKTEKINYRMQ